MKLFQLNRIKDISGVSGIGIVAEGIEFSNGKCVVSWLTEHTSVVVYDDMKTLIAIHGHDGNTEVVFITVSTESNVSNDNSIELTLTMMEYNLLEFLRNNQGKVMTHVQIARELWGETDRLVAPEMTRPLCSRLRKKIGQEKIVTARGRGYMYIAP